MSITKHMSRVAAIGAAAALGAAALVGSAPAADAAVAPVDTSYGCTVLGQTVPMDVSVKITLPKSAKAGKTVAAQPFQMAVTIPADLVATIASLGVTDLGGNANDVKFTIGKTAVAVNKVAMAETPIPASGPLTVLAKGKSAPFKIAKKGTYAVKVPASFNFQPLKQGGEEIVPGLVLPCSLTGKSAAGTFKVTK